MQTRRKTLTPIVILAVLGVLAMVACGSPSDGPIGTSAVGGRPADVPPDYLTTPHGYFHPSCIQQLAEGEIVVGGDKIQSQDGTMRNVSACGFPSYDVYGKRTVWWQPPEAAPGQSDWAADDGEVVSAPVGSMSASWTVPSAPVKAGKQTVYLFPGLEQANAVNTILQPVLGWMNGSWSISSWNCCQKGNVFNSALVNVNAGDSISGTMTSSGCDAKGVCTDWTITTSSSSGKSSVLKTKSYGQAFNWAFGGVLELYDVTDCSLLPSNNSVQFSGISATSTAGKAISMSYSPSYGGGSAACGYNATSGGSGNVTITWTSKAAGDGGTEGGKGEGGMPMAKEGGEGGEGGDMGEGGSMGEGGMGEGGMDEGGSMGEGGMGEGGGYAFVERRSTEGKRVFDLAAGAVETIPFKWIDAQGVAPPADLGVEAGGRTALQVSSSGSAPFARAGLDVVPLIPDAPYRIQLARTADGVAVSLLDENESVLLRTAIPTLDRGKVATVTVPMAPYRSSVVSASLTQP